MERNHNEQQIVMSVEHYESLLAIANKNYLGDYRRIKKHVRKFNPFLQAPHQAKVLEIQAIRNKQIREAKAFFHANVGKVVYARVDMLGCTKGDKPVFMPVVVQRIHQNRRCIAVRQVGSLFALQHKRYDAVTTDALQLELPEGYVQGVGAYHKYMVEANGPYDIREEEAEKEREYQRRVAERKDIPFNQCVDVLVETKHDDLK